MEPIICMASKTISVAEEVYSLLEKEKAPGESFSETLARLVHNRGKLSDCAGLLEGLSEEEMADIEHGIKEVRASANRRVIS